MAFGDQRLQPVVLAHRRQQLALREHELGPDQVLGRLQHGDAVVVVVGLGGVEFGEPVLQQPAGEVVEAELQVDVHQPPQVGPAGLPALDLGPQRAPGHQQRLELAAVANVRIDVQGRLDRLAGGGELAHPGQGPRPHHPDLARGAVLLGHGVEDGERLRIAALLDQGGQQHADEAVPAQGLQRQCIGGDQGFADGADRQSVVIPLGPLGQRVERPGVAFEQLPVALRLDLEAEPALTFQLIQMAVGQGHARARKQPWLMPGARRRF